MIPLINGPASICPVQNLIEYLKISSPTRGKLFFNSKKDNHLHSTSVARILCEVINEADPGSFPQAHDIRRVVTLLHGLEVWSQWRLPKEPFGNHLMVC